MYGLKLLQRWEGGLYSRMAPTMWGSVAARLVEPSGIRWTPRRWHKAEGGPGFHIFDPSRCFAEIADADRMGLGYTLGDYEIWIAEIGPASALGKPYPGSVTHSYCGQLCRLVERIPLLPPSTNVRLVPLRATRHWVDGILGYEIQIKGKWLRIFDPNREKAIVKRYKEWSR